MKNSIRLSLIFLSGVLLAACDNYELGGKTAQEAFDDPQTAALVQAAIKGDSTQVSALIEKGVDPNASGAQGTTPLLWALVFGGHRGVAALLENGADPNQKFENGSSAVTMVAKGDNPGMLAFLLEHGGDPNASNSFRPALHLAVLNHREDNVEVLLSHGANVNALDGNGRSAAQVASAVGNVQLAYKLVKDKGLSVNLDELDKTLDNLQFTSQSEQFRWRERLHKLIQKMTGPDRHASGY
jgi:ankyrin repeat protein